MTLFWYKNKYNLSNKKDRIKLFLLLLFDKLYPIILVSFFQESILSALQSQKTLEIFALFSIAIGLFLADLIFSYKDIKNYLKNK